MTLEKDQNTEAGAVLNRSVFFGVPKALPLIIPQELREIFHVEHEDVADDNGSNR